jgi:hypothetical protein
MIFEYHSKNKIILSAVFVVFLLVGIFFLVHFKFLDRKVDETPAVGTVLEDLDNPLSSEEVKNEFWKEYTGDDGVSFQYPEKLLTEYIFTQEWPPLVKVKSGNYFCRATSPSDSGLHEIIAQRLVDDRIYCVDVKHEGAAGSVYSSYIYIAPKNDELVEVSFILIYPNCGNYDEEKNQACVSEREAFDLDAIVDRIVQTVKLDSLPSDNNFSGELKDCLSKSGLASKEKCDQLIKTIKNFDECVSAGFSVIKSNPLQCTTPDGLIFSDGTNSTWEMAVEAVNNCEVEKVFQAHSRVTTLTLKNGNKLTATEPEIDDIMKITAGVEDKCGRVLIGTE